MRDDFADSIRRALALRVGHRCSRPDCDAATAGPQDDQEKSINLGVAAHITAASIGGPRYDPSLTSADRSAASNGIWLCQNCAKLIDNDESRFPVWLLRDWKARAENAAFARLGRTEAPSSAPALTLLPRPNSWLLFDETKYSANGNFVVEAEFDLFIGPSASIHLVGIDGTYSKSGHACLQRAPTLLVDDERPEFSSDWRRLRVPIALEAGGSYRLLYKRKLQPPTTDQFPVDCEYGTLDLALDVRIGGALRIDHLAFSYEYQRDGTLLEAAS